MHGMQESFHLLQQKNAGLCRKLLERAFSAGTLLTFKRGNYRFFRKRHVSAGRSGSYEV